MPLLFVQQSETVSWPRQRFYLENSRTCQNKKLRHKLETIYSVMPVYLSIKDRLSKGAKKFDKFEKIK